MSLLLFHYISLMLLVITIPIATIIQGKPNLLMVQTLTRHGSRAPDKIVAEQTCKPLFKQGTNVHQLFVHEFGTGPAELTDVGSTQMRDVGRFLMERYGRKGFIKADYPPHTTEWIFNAREGARQQRSMMGIVQGMFPDDAVPILVRPRAQDAILGGPAPQCAEKTRDYIMKWHASVGKSIVEQKYESVVKPFELLCDVSLRDNPTNPTPNGGNPHAWIGDISDLMDSLLRNQRGELPISPELHADLTALAFDLEQRAHFDDPRGPTMFAGEFPEHLLSGFEHKLINGRGPKMYLHTCSREVFYGLEHMFGWQNSFQISPTNPPGQIRSGTTFIFELYDDGSMKALLWSPSVWGNYVVKLQPDTTLQDFRSKYDTYVKQHGTWQSLCGAQVRPEIIDTFFNNEEDQEQIFQDDDEFANNKASATIKSSSKPSYDELFLKQTIMLIGFLLLVIGMAWCCARTSWRRRLGYQSV
jgi:hypothetical protein